MKKTFITLSAAENLIQRYINAGGTCNELHPGCLGLGTITLTGPGLRAFVIEEIYLNNQSSGHVLKTYYSGILPRKYRPAE